MVLGCLDLAAAEPLSFNVLGTGSASQGVSGLSDSPFWWIDATGGVSGAPLDPYGFDLFVGPGVTGIGSPWSGSLMMSNSFTLAEGETLSVAMTVLSAGSENFNGLGFGLLLGNSTVQAVLANTRPDGVNHFGDLPHPSDVDFTSPSSGVAYHAASGAIDSTFMLGGVQYGHQSQIGSCLVRTCETDIVSSVTPGAGTYQLLFGAYGVGTPSAVAVRSVTTSVPEPGTLALFGLPLAVQIWRRRRQSANHSSLA